MKRGRLPATYLRPAWCEGLSKECDSRTCQNAQGATGTTCALWRRTVSSPPCSSVVPMIARSDRRDEHTRRAAGEAGDLAQTGPQRNLSSDHRHISQPGTARSDRGAAPLLVPHCGYLYRVKEIFKNLRACINTCNNILDSSCADHSASRCAVCALCTPVH